MGVSTYDTIKLGVMYVFAILFAVMAVYEAIFGGGEWMLPLAAAWILRNAIGIKELEYELHKHRHPQRLIA